MKKVTLSIVALAALAVMGFSSCKKCKDCTGYNINTGTYANTITQEFCGDALDTAEGQTALDSDGNSVPAWECK